MRNETCLCQRKKRTSAWTVLPNASEDRMFVEKRFPACRIVWMLALLSLGFTARASAQNTWAVEKTLHVGGEGGWDYMTVDPDSHRLYVPRSTHTMIIDTESGKTVADIPGQKHNHGVALVPGSGRRVHQRWQRRGRNFRSQDQCCTGNNCGATGCGRHHFRSSQRTRAGRVW